MADTIVTNFTQILRFLKEVEGNVDKPYVPDVGKSGVTIGIGVDLGNMNFSNVGLSKSLQDKISPYYGKYQDEARQYLADNPLKLDQYEIDYISALAIQTHLNELNKWYSKQADVPFIMLTNNQKTVMMSVKYQYGNLPRRTPKFWQYCISRDWHGAYYELMHFGDAYPSRREKEARLLAKDFNNGST